MHNLCRNLVTCNIRLSGRQKWTVSMRRANRPTTVSSRELLWFRYVGTGVAQSGTPQVRLGLSRGQWQKNIPMWWFEFFRSILPSFAFSCLLWFRFPIIGGPYLVMEPIISRWKRSCTELFTYAKKLDKVVV